MLSNPEDRAAVNKAGDNAQVMATLIRLANDYRGRAGYEGRVAELDAAMDQVDTVTAADLAELTAYVRAGVA
ncbi:hypothetical protein MED01_002456 [Micromonospora sp. MED01]|uniref:hypothetical protein n=1 Tax=Micromonospora alfalfae TaxID=2911212 RepID=UPI001EE8B40D|nr:hypothetical protein [Micromonospora alfalfae]MCG5464290.1 hypothetical protein [Micromonospora alfalfae]